MMLKLVGCVLAYFYRTLMSGAVFDHNVQKCVFNTLEISLKYMQEQNIRDKYNNIKVLIITKNCVHIFRE